MYVYIYIYIYTYTLQYDILSGAVHRCRPYGALEMFHTGGSVLGVGVAMLVCMCAYACMFIVCKCAFVWRCAYSIRAFFAR